MTAPRAKLSPDALVRLRAANAARSLGAVAARRLTEVLTRADEAARARMEAAHDAEKIFASAAAEAREILDAMPDFSALERESHPDGSGALSALRDSADAAGLPVAAVTGHAPPPDWPKNHAAALKRLREAAVVAVIQSCPWLSDAGVASLFRDVVPGTVRRLRGPGQFDGGDKK